jgi:hypothetical protein
VTVIIGQRVQFYFRGASLDWSAFQNGEWVNLQNTMFLDHCDGSLRYSVSGSSYQIFLRGALVFDGAYGTPVSGPLTLEIQYGESIDNLTITSP